MFGGGRKKTRMRIEPRLDSRAGGLGGDLRADPADRPPTNRKNRKAPSRAGPTSKRSTRRRSLFGHLVYWGVVLSVWGVDRLNDLRARHAQRP